MNIIDRFLSRYRWRWVGTVEGVCNLVDDQGKRTVGGNKSKYWNLYEWGDGKRRFQEIAGSFGKFYSSQHQRVMEASVKAWVHGGPLPKLCVTGLLPTPRLKAKLIAFPGGKDGAA